MKKKVNIQYNYYSDTENVRVRHLPDFLANVTDGNFCNDSMGLVEEIREELDNTRVLLGKLIEILVLKGSVTKEDLKNLLECWKWKVVSIDINEDSGEITEYVREVMQEHGILEGD